MYFFMMHFHNFLCLKQLIFSRLFREVLFINQKEKNALERTVLLQRSCKSRLFKNSFAVINTLKYRAGVSAVQSTLGADGAAVWIYFP